MKYITRKDGRNRETVDQFDTLKEARAMAREYQTADPSAEYYVSGRACAGWHGEPATPTPAAP
jgi:hypothetical protein